MTTTCRPARGLAMEAWARLAAPSLLTVLTVAGGACASRTGHVAGVPPVALAQPAPPAPAPTPPAAVDARLNHLLAGSRAAAARGQAELADGHLAEAREAFDQALDVLLTADAPLRDQPDVRAETERLIVRVSTLELELLGEPSSQTGPAAAGATLATLLATPTFGPPAEATARSVANDLGTTSHDIDIPMNARVLSYVELLTGRLRGFLEEALGRGARFLPMIQDILRAEGLPTDLAFVPVVESAFNPTALSRAKARGLWQLMRGTAVENGLRHDWYVDERAEPERATVAAARYLKTLHGRFGDWHLALASYNGGPGRVQKAMKRSGKTDFWTLSATPRFLPRETRDYVPLMLAAVIVARNPAQYGLTITPAPDAPAFETVDVTAPVDLRRLSEAIGHPVSVIQDLNPALRRWVTPPRADTFRLRLPEGARDAASAYLAAGGGEEAPFAWHTVHKGQTLRSIARQLRVTRRDLAEANFLSLRATVRPGSRLVVPRPPATLASLSAKREAGVPDDTVPARPTAAARARKGAAGAATHRVRKGDTLGSIARRYRTTIAELRRWNGLTGTTIKAGDRLRLRPQEAAAYN